MKERMDIQVKVEGGGVVVGGGTSGGYWEDDDSIEAHRMDSTYRT